LPQVRVLSMESSRAFGLCVLESLVQEMDRRGALFKKAGVSDLAHWREHTGETLARIVVIIDEFQVLLVGQDRFSREAAERLDDITRRGRSFGLHLVLSTQTLKNTNINDSTLSNIAIRIGLQMDESDCAKFFHRDNLAASSLKKVGEAYYNTGQGRSEDNVRFQVAFLDRNKEIPGRVEQLRRRGQALDNRHISKPKNRTWKRGSTNCFDLSKRVRRTLRTANCLMC
jgi:DNA segregation ATPase FtsK/SpoIIIE-like protein